MTHHERVLLTQTNYREIWTVMEEYTDTQTDPDLLANKLAARRIPEHATDRDARIARLAGRIKEELDIELVRAVLEEKF